MGKSILIIKGSPRVNGNRATLADQVYAGAEMAGAEVESIYLSGSELNPCDACDACQEGNQGYILEGHMQALYPKLKAADVLVPIYYSTITAQTKAFIDRWYALESNHGSGLKGKGLALALAYSDTDLYTSGGIIAIHTFESIARYIGLKISGMVYGTAEQLGDAEKQPFLMA